MIYKLLHKIFGWDYVAWKNNCDYGIARVHKLDDGIVFYWRYKNIKCADVINPCNPYLVGTAMTVMWLTCHPNKYFKED